MLGKGCIVGIADHETADLIVFTIVNHNPIPIAPRLLIVPLAEYNLNSYSVLRDLSDGPVKSIVDGAAALAVEIAGEHLAKRSAATTRGVALLAFGFFDTEHTRILKRMNHKYTRQCLKNESTPIKLANQEWQRTS